MCLILWELLAYILKPMTNLTPKVKGIICYGTYKSVNAFKMLIFNSFFHSEGMKVSNSAHTYIYFLCEN